MALPFWTCLANTLATTCDHQGNLLQILPMVEVASTAHFFNLPPPHSSDMPYWFIQAEQLFPDHGINQELAKYYHVIAVLPKALMTRNYGRLTLPPPPSAYTDLKSKLVHRTSSAPCPYIDAIVAQLMCQSSLAISPTSSASTSCKYLFIHRSRTQETTRTIKAFQ